jgi:hypothetical protein
MPGKETVCRDVSSTGIGVCSADYCRLVNAPSTDGVYQLRKNVEPRIASNAPTSTSQRGPLFTLFDYSYRNASIGFSIAAFLAG